jgi:hypothetical protein
MGLSLAMEMGSLGSGIVVRFTSDMGYSSFYRLKRWLALIFHAVQRESLGYPPLNKAPHPVGLRRMHLI